MSKVSTIFGHKSKEKWRPKAPEPKVLKRSTQSIINATINQTIDKRKIDVIITSVDYNDFLILSLENNTKYFENITVVTSNDDIICQNICKSYGVKCITTDAFYEDDFVFNKGKAINIGIESIVNPEFILLLDADIIVTNKFDLSNLELDTLYTSDRWICYNHFQYEKWKKGETSVNNLPKYERDNGYGFFQLFNFNNSLDVKWYPSELENSSHPDLKFSSYFPKKQTIDVDIIHLGYVKKNWNGRKSEKFLTDEQFNEILGRKSTYKICSFYYNFRGDSRQKTNFIKFLDQWKGHYDKLIVGLVDYEDGDLDFEIPCEKIIIKDNKENKLWSKEILINNIIDKVNTDYLLWIDGDLIYNNLDWLNNIDDVAKGNDFIQLFETINYIDEGENITNVFKSIASSNKTNVDYLLSKGFRPGGAWMGRTSILKEKNLFEKMYVGGGDTIFTYGLYKNQDGRTLKEVQKYNSEIYKEANQWINNFGDYKVGYLNETVNHLYHGDLKDRNYNGRYSKLIDIKPKRIVVFTENIGEYDHLKPINRYENTRCIAFVDKDMVVDGWEIINVNNIEQIKSLKHTKLICKYIRTHSYELLPDHDYSLHIDANMTLTTDPNKILEEIINKSHSLMAFNHYKRETIYDEAKQCIEWELDNVNRISEQIDRYKKEGVVGKLYECGFLLRKNTKEVQSFDQIWWSEVLQNSHRDQISFPYVIEKTGISIKAFNHTNRMNSDYVKIDEIKRGITHKGSRVFNNNITMLYEDSREKWGSTKMRAFDIASKIKCDVLPLSKSSEIKYKKLVVLKLSSYKKILKLTEYNEVVIDMVDFNRHIHDLSIFKNFDYGIFTSEEQIKKLNSIFKYPEKCKVIHHHWDERFRNIEINYSESVNICYFGQPEKCYKFNNFNEINYHTIDWYDFDDKLKLYNNYNVHFAVKPQEEEEKIQPSTKISTASALGCPIIINKSNQNIELLGLEYPYYCNPDDESVNKTLLKIKSEFETDSWFLAKRILYQIKERTNLDTVSKKYLNL